MKKIKFSGYEWITQERWGQVHPDKKYVWYDEDAVIVHPNGEVSLFAKSRPRYFPETGVSHVGIGLISSTHQFSYGKFEIEAMLPNFPYSWPSFWMWSWSDWPPEIDVFEAYSNEKGNYATSWLDRIFKNIFFNVKSNIHIKDENRKWDIQDIAHHFTYLDPRKNFNKFGVNWNPDKIEFYYNDKLVRLVDDPNILKLINGHTMNVIINNSCWKPHDRQLTAIGEMKIKNFKYTPL